MSPASPTHARYEPSDLLSMPFAWPDALDSPLLLSTLQRLTPPSALLLLVSSQPLSQPQTEPWYGTQYELQSVFKTVALQQMLIGDTRKAFDTWKMDGLPYEKLLVKLKENARSQRLDGEAARGKQAVHLNKTAKWADAEDDIKEPEEPAQTEEELNALANVK